jgi:acyl CoA:acetate/3-ketoacid CoA transferase beta subunit
MMIVAAAREIKEIVARRNYQTLLSGIGAPGLAAWLAFYLMKGEGRPIDLMTGTGQVGFSPRPGDPFLMSLSNVVTCTMLTDTTDVYGVFVGGATNRCLSVLGTAQVDPYGNLNTVKMGGLYFIGVGGAGDAINASETLAMARQARERFVENVEFIGCPGRTIRTLVTDLGVFQKRGEEEMFTLTKLNAHPSIQGREDRLKEIKEKCGWDVKIGEALEEVLPPSAEELSVVRSLDPERVFLGK